MLAEIPPTIHLPAAVAMNEAPKRRMEVRFTPIETHVSQEGQSQHPLRAENPLAPTSERPSPVRNSIESSTERRSLPSQDVTDQQFDDAYVCFIMYCNPSLGLDTDTAELRKILRTPPKSDGKTFSPFTLFQLVRKLENKEIKTWAQLAIDLGVEPPSDGQSAQKIQQYCVRLKRWMHAMHVDAFFEYLVGKAHIYWMQVPSANAPFSELPRDGVAPDEDLALRALLPETRPKRGRRKAEDRDNDSDITRSPAQRPRLDSPTLSEDFMMARVSLMPDGVTPASAHPAFQQSFESRVSNWSTSDGRIPMGDTFHWGPTIDSIQTPSTAYPKTALTPSNRTMMPWGDEPRSAITPNRNKMRRRLGSTVSSAWPSNGSASSGKLRGRPPSNRSVTDGPFSTFPANPSRGASKVPGTTPAATPVVGDSGASQFFPAIERTSSPGFIQKQMPNGRPARLSLQVPQRQGGSVRLASPRPGLMLSGEINTNIHGDMMSRAHQSPLDSDVFDGTVTEDPNPHHFVSIAFRQTEDMDRTNVDSLESHFKWEILAAEWYDVLGNSIECCTIGEADKICKQVINNLRAESSNSEAFLLNLSALAGGPLTTRLRMTKLHEYSTRTAYECHREMRFSSIEGSFTIRATISKSTLAEHTTSNDDDEGSWKAKYLGLEQKLRERDQMEGSLKRGVLNALVVSNEYNKI